MAVSFEGPDHRPHRRYTVTLRSLGGAIKTVPVLTNRGEAKAVYLAVIASSGFARRPRALDIEVRDDGSPELDSRGVPILNGYAFDRDEW
jgi:hypothetical protein